MDEHARVCMQWTGVLSGAHSVPGIDSRPPRDPDREKLPKMYWMKERKNKHKATWNMHCRVLSSYKEAGKHLAKTVYQIDQLGLCLDSWLAQGWETEVTKLRNPESFHLWQTEEAETLRWNGCFRPGTQPSLCCLSYLLTHNTTGAPNDCLGFQTWTELHLHVSINETLMLKQPLIIPTSS